MKIAIMSDLHLGKRMYRTEDGFINKYEKINYDTFNNNIDIILERKPDLIIFAGDIFDKPNPSVLALDQLKAGLDRLKEFESLMILGNHDFSFNNKNNNCSSVSTVADCILAEYRPTYAIINEILFILLPYAYDKVENIPEIWKEIEILFKEYKQKHNILVTHGMTEVYAKNNPDIRDAFVIPEKIVQLFDEVFIGHIHTPFEYQSKNTSVISPGSLIDYQAKKVRTGPCFYDTNTKTLDRVIVSTPHIIKEELNAKTINSFLKNVGQFIYNITYDGDVSAIDNDLFIEAKRRAVNIVLSLKKNEAEEKDIVLQTNFYAWLQDNVDEHTLALFDEAKLSLV